MKVRREFTSRVPSQVCAPEVEAAISGPLQNVKTALNARMMFKGDAPPATVTAPPVTAPPAAALPAAVSPAAVRGESSVAPEIAN